jgi:hypothetical protein
VRLLVVLCLAATLNTAAKAEEAAEPPLVCGDFLKQLDLQRPDVEFSSCASFRDNGRQPEGLEAVYRVQGKDIAKVESWLIRIAEVKPLVFACCGWQTPNDGTLTDRNGSTYLIGMGGEALVSQRKDFSKIPYLNVYVRHYWYAP